MITWIIVGSLIYICIVLSRIAEDLRRFREGVHMRDISIKEKKTLVDAIETILIKVEGINTDVSYLEERSRR